MKDFLIFVGVVVALLLIAWALNAFLGLVAVPGIIFGVVVLMLVFGLFGGLSNFVEDK